ncbi:TPA: ABC transporter ATP-binding protein [Candidatus Woesearchaeota archaeon]|nr:ABC transporter ATP-binding protein [Candidatus Woesearchaeota archaeon]
MRSGDIVIEARHLERMFQVGEIELFALKDINLTIRKGEFVALMGPSGAGKSTTLNQLALLDRPTGGILRVLGEDVEALSARKQTVFRLLHLGFVFQNYNLLPQLTAIENVILPAMMRGRRKRDAIFEAKCLLDEFDMGHRLHNYPSQLSGGQQQKVSIARALVNKPAILFADEPTASLDSESSKVIMDLLRRLNRENEQTIVLVSHEPEHQKLVDRIIWVEDGVVVDKSYV